MQNSTHFLRKTKCCITVHMFKGQLCLDTTRTVLPHVNLRGQQGSLHRKQKLHRACQWKEEALEQHFLALTAIYPFTKGKQSHLLTAPKQRLQETPLRRVQIFPKSMLEEMKVSGFSLNMYICKLATLTANDSPDVHSFPERCKTC